MSEDFSNAPKSFTELRSDVAKDFRLGTVRDALVSVLRDLDAGKINPDYMAILWRNRDPNEKNEKGDEIKSPVYSYQSYKVGKDTDTLIGVVTRVTDNLLDSLMYGEPDDED